MAYRLASKPSEWEAVENRIWERIQEAQSTEPMSVDQIEPFLRKAFQDKFGTGQPTTERVDCLYKMAKEIQPLTVQQGFVPDWNHPAVKETHNGQKCTGVFAKYVYEPAEKVMGDHQYTSATFIPRPASKMRKKTREEKIEDLDSLPFLGVYPKQGGLTDERIDALCLAMKIPLETQA